MGKYNIITIERQFASGGRQIGILLAEKLGILFYNEEILQLAAKNLNIPADYVQHAEETASSSLMYAMAVASTASNFAVEPPLADKLFYEESRIIEDLAQKGSCVIVGRCAGYILRERKDCLSVFIYADETIRIKRAVEEYGILEKDVHSQLNKIDKRRTGFYNAHSTKKWGGMDTYHMCLNSGELGIFSCVETIAAVALG